MTINEYKGYYNIIMGDWNSKVRSKEDRKGVMGQYGIGDMNERGETLIDFGESNNLKLAATFFKKKCNRKWTCGSHRMGGLGIKSTTS